MAAAVSCQELSALMPSPDLYAVFDVRERGESNQEQIPGATSLPRSQIEFRIAELVPDRNIPIVLYDEDGERAPRARCTLVELGHNYVSLLAGGLPAWKAQGYGTVSGVNVPSKAFGEKVHHERQVADMTPEQLKALQDRGEELVILDVRTPEEYGRFCIPGGQSVPGGELILWADELRRRPTVIVNCAGRTRSIIAAAALRRLGLTNVRALRNGTMGWVLAGLELEQKPGRGGPQAPAESRESAVAAAQRIAEEEKLSFLTVEECQKLGNNERYLIDVRSEKEFAEGHIDGSINVPGGQAVQRSDDFVAVRNAKIVFVSSDGTRATMAAYWYREMGFPQVFILSGGSKAWQASGDKLLSGTPESKPLGLDAVLRETKMIDAADLAERAKGERPLILDVGTSLDYESGHLPGAKWISRGWLDIKLPGLFPDRAKPIIVTCSDGRQSAFAARALVEIGWQNVAVLRGGIRAWQERGHAIETGLTDALIEPNDVVLSPSIRGTKEDMQNYLNWELKLKL